MKNYTPVPNEIFDEWMSIMSPTAYKILMAICRKILGYKEHREKKSDNISISQIEELTGLPQRTILRKLPELENKKLIIIKKKNGKTNNITLNLTSDNLTDDNLTDDNLTGVTKCQMTPDKIGSGTPDKMSDTKEKRNTTKETSTHHKLITYFDTKYFELTDNKFDWSNKKHVKQVQLLLKNHTEKEIYDKLKILEELIKNNNSTFWVMIPDFVNSNWNNIVYNKQQPERRSTVTRNGINVYRDTGEPVE